MTFQQDDKLIDILRRSQVCPHLRQFNDGQMDGLCETAMHDPTAGHVPRGFGGATGKLEDVRLVVVSNGPTDPIAGESYSGSPEDDLQSILSGKYMFDETQGIHKNLRLFLNWVFPELENDFNAQRRHIWTTNSLQCTFISPVIEDRRRCCTAYLIPTLRLFNDPPIVIAGVEAQKVVTQIVSAVPGARVIPCHSFAPRNIEAARQSWQSAAEQSRQHIADRTT